MAHMAPTSKMPNQKKQYYMQAGGYVLLRYVDEGDNYTVMTATAGEDLPYDPPPERPKGRSIFTGPDGMPLTPKKPVIPAHGPIRVEAYPSLEKLIAAAEMVLSPLGKIEPQRDNFGRQYLMVTGVSDTGVIRRAANALAVSLGLEIVQDKTAEEEMQEIWEEFSVEEGPLATSDVQLGDGLRVTRSGRVKS